MYPIILGAITGLIPSFFIIFYARKAFKKREQLQHSKMKKYVDKQAFSIRYSPQERFSRIWKFFPWESSGVLVINDQTISCDLSSKSGGRLTLEFDIKDISLYWIGRSHWVKNGAASWFVIEEKSKRKHYFTSETGTLILGSRKTTKHVLDAINK